MIFRPLSDRSDSSGVGSLVEVLAAVLGRDASLFASGGFEVEDFIRVVNSTGRKGNNSCPALLLNWGSRNEDKSKKES